MIVYCAIFSFKRLSTSLFPLRLLSTANIITMENILKPPDFIQGMEKLNKDIIKKIIQVSYLSIKKESVNNIIPILKKYLLKIEKFKAVQHISDNEVNIYLSPISVKDWLDLPGDTRCALEQLDISKDDLTMKDFELNYDNFSADDLLKAILPKDKEGMSSFTKVGHIIHVNLREHLLPFKNVIGEILYDKIPGCKSVVNKVNLIDNTYRNFSMEVLKGSDDMLTTVKENNCNFRFDFSKVYWNSRLSTEHERIVKIVGKNNVLFDIFAGVGPFSVPVAKNKSIVYANDLNPESYKWLEYNAKSNKVSSEYFKSFNKDGKDFILTELKQFLPKYLKQKIFITMNLPAMAVEFLKYFEDLFTKEELEDFDEPPTIFVYCFVKGENYLELTKKLILSSFNIDITDNIIDMFRVRTVSSLKEMMRVSIKLDKNILLGNNVKRKFEDELDNKFNKKTILDKNGQEQEES